MACGVVLRRSPALDGDKNQLFFQLHIANRGIKSIQMAGHYNPVLVLLSIAVACLASYTALDLARRIGTLETVKYRRIWLAGGAVALGIGIWSMHFIGMLALSMPISLGYSLPITLLSMIIAIAVSLLVLHTVTGSQLSTSRLVISGLIMGIGIAAMHYTGMAAMQMQPSITYIPWVFAASIAIAIAASIAALWIAFHLRRGSRRFEMLSRLGAALVMGLAITGMHYTGMAAAVFAPGSVCLAATDINHTWMAMGITGTTLAIMTITLILSILDARMESATGKLAYSLQEANEQLLYQATHDALTDLPNRRLFVDRLQHAIHAARRSHHHCGVLFLDLDGFKAVNDSLGHAVGDDLLKEVTQRIQAQLREEDMVARMGGDEFVILIEDVKEPNDLAMVCLKLLAHVGSPCEISDISLSVTSSIGIAVFPQDGDTVDMLLANADAAMYETKQSGRNSYRFFKPSMNVNSLRTLQIQAGLREAIGSEQLSLYFQPKFNGKDRRLVGAEVLLRWNHPEFGNISPAEFIPIAENSGLISEIGDWVLEAACRQLCIWREENRTPIKIAINLSPQQFRQANLAQDILNLISGYGLAPSLFMFEITESVVMENAEANVATLQKFQDMGFQIAIDDFGTGYSSLSYLRQFHVQQLKVDMSFVQGLDRGGDQDQAIVAAIIALSRALNMEVVAEGVETQRQLAILNDLGCNQVQGYLLGKPVPSEQFSQLLGAKRETVDNTAASDQPLLWSGNSL